MFALGVEGADFFLQVLDNRLLFAELRVEGFRMLLGGGASVALRLHEIDGAGYALFQGRKIAAAEGEVRGCIVVVQSGLLGFGMFRDLGFQG